MSAFALDLVRHTLENGLRVVIHPDRSSSLVAVNLWYHVGSKNERPGRTGFAHLFEHMLFQGSEHVGTNDHFRYLQQVGGVANGSTWYDRTNYYETLPAEHLDLALWLESDRMGFLLPAMTPEKLENQRSVVMNERRERVDNRPYGRAFERLHELLYPDDHPYHWPVIGYMEDIEAASLEEVRAFFSTYYRPNNAVLTLAGDLDPEDAIGRAEAWFGALPAGPEPPPALRPTGEAARGRREVQEDAVELSRVYLGWEVAPYGHPDWYAADVLATVLAGGKSSRLYRDLVYDRQIAQDVSAWVFPTEEAATFALVATARPGTAPEELSSALHGHLRDLADSAPDAGEMERARNRLLTGLWGELESLEHRADLLSQMTTFFDDPARVATEASRFEAVEPSAVREAAARHPSDACVEVVVVPEEAG